jgi:hypothetical protein
MRREMFQAVAKESIGESKTVLTGTEIIKSYRQEDKTPRHWRPNY